MSEVESREMYRKGFMVGVLTTSICYVVINGLFVSFTMDGCIYAAHDQLVLIHLTTL